MVLRQESLEPTPINPIFSMIDDICTNGTNRNLPPNPNIVVFGRSKELGIQAYKWFDEDGSPKFALNVNSSFVYFDDFGNITRTSNPFKPEISYKREEIIEILENFQEV